MAIQIEVVLNQIVCRDTESIHSADKFALAGAIHTDTDSAGVLLPMMRINSGETRVLNLPVFSGTCKEPRVGIDLQAWDLDQNDSWTENEETIRMIAAEIASAAKMVPKYGLIVGAVLDGVNEVVPRVVNKFIEWDRNDQLLNYSSWVDPPTGAAFVTTSKSYSIRFQRESPLGYSSYDYNLDFTVKLTDQPSFGPSRKPTPVPSGRVAMATFRHRADYAHQNGFVGGFPNFYEAVYGRNHVGGTVLFNADAAEWRDVPLSVLHAVDLEDFGARMRFTQDYAVAHGFVGGFPNFYHRVS